LSLWLGVTGREPHIHQGAVSKRNLTDSAETACERGRLLVAFGAFLAGQVLVVIGLMLALLELRGALLPVELEARQAIRTTGAGPRRQAHYTVGRRS
jgi:hypothetical protein